MDCLYCRAGEADCNDGLNGGVVVPRAKGGSGDVYVYQEVKDQIKDTGVSDLLELPWTS